jgi:long-chain acyl-CoA synthetase
MMRVGDLVAQQAKAYGPKLYGVDTESRVELSFEGLQAFQRDLGEVLKKAGLTPGMHIGLLMPNGIGTLASLLGCMANNYSVNPINLLCTEDQMRYIVDHSEAQALIVSAEWEARAKALLSDRPNMALLVMDPHSLDMPTIQKPGQTLAMGAHPAELALLMYTSGTTGRPKGVMLTHTNLLSNAASISKEHALKADDRVYAVLPLYHINAFGVTMMATLWHGGSLAMPPKFSAKQFWSQVKDFECSWMNVVPTIISYLIDQGPTSQSQEVRLKFCRSASAPLPPEHHKAFEEMFGIGIIETMGLTETVAPSFSNPLDPGQRKIGSVGRPSGCEAVIADEQGRPLTAGETGEVIIRGPNVTIGYFKNEEGTASAFFPDGWLRTGDLGQMDTDGFFFITGRIKELIIKGGENIAPREIDEILLQHPSVLDAAAVGVPHKHYGQDIAACVILKEGHTAEPEEFIDWVKTRLGAFKAPSQIRLVTDLPRGPSGKVQRLKLVDTFAVSLD